MKKEKQKLIKRITALLATLSLVLSFFVVTGTGKPAKAASELSNPTTDSNGVSTWDCIYFGSYPQSAYTPKQAPANPVSDTEYTDSDGTKMVYREWEKREWNEDKEDYENMSYQGYFKIEPIKWRVLSVNGDDAFLLANQNLDVKPYNEEWTNVTWETCTLHTWLNSTFLLTAFTSAEQSAIKNTTVINDDLYYGTEGGKNTIDQVYLLSIAEASNTAYGFNGDFETDSETREAKNTAYARARGAWSSTSTVYEGNGWWWLRSPGYSGSSAADVDDGGCGEGNFFGVSVSCGVYAVRPALHLNLSSSNLWSYAGKVTSNGEDGESATPTSTPVPGGTGGNTHIATPTPTPGISSSISSVTSSPSADSAKVTAPAKVTLKSAKNQKGKKVLVKWKKVNKADGYQIQVAQKKTFKGKKSVTTTKTSYTIKKLKKKKTYYVRVRAYKMNGQKKVYGKWSAVKKVKIKK